jgi:hypothetical protein
MQALTRICDDAQSVVDIYVNYDCDLGKVLKVQLYLVYYHLQVPFSIVKKYCQCTLCQLFYLLKPVLSAIF